MLRGIDESLREEGNQIRRLPVSRNALPSLSSRGGEQGGGEELIRSLSENATVERVILCTQSDAEMNIIKSALENALKNIEGEKQSLLCSTNTSNQSRFHMVRLLHSHNLQTGSRNIL